MPTRVEPGHYHVEEKHREEEKKSIEETKTYGVIRGDTANETVSGPFANQYGFRASKWYAYVSTATSVQPRLRFSPTAPSEAFSQHFTEVSIAQEEFDTKKEAVERAEEMVDGHRY